MMFYSSSIVPLSLLLGVSGIAVSAAAPPLCTKDLSVYMGGQLYRRSAKVGAGPLDTSTSLLDLSPNSTELTGSISSIVGPTGPVIITTTKDLTRNRLSSEEVIGTPSDSSGDRAGTTKQTDGRINIQQTSGSIDGYLSIVSASDQGPMTVKLASLGFLDDNTGHSPFELGPETQLGSLVSLDPTEPIGVLSDPLDLQVSNQTAAFFDARSVPLSIFSTYNATNTSTNVAAFVETPITARLKANISGGNPATGLSFCVTYNSNYGQLQDEPPIRLQRCEDAYIPGTSSGSRSSSETQLWQYSPITGKIRPLLLVMEMTPSGQVEISPLGTPPMFETATSNDSMAVETAPPVPTPESALAVTAAQGKAGTVTGAVPTGSGVPSQNMARRKGNDVVDVQRSKPKRPKSPRPGSAIQKQGAAGHSLAAASFVDPYSLVFTPKSTIKSTSAKAHELPS